MLALILRCCFFLVWQVGQKCNAVGFCCHCRRLAFALWNTMHCSLQTVMVSMECCIKNIWSLMHKIKVWGTQAALLQLYCTRVILRSIEWSLNIYLTLQHCRVAFWIATSVQCAADTRIVVCIMAGSSVSSRRVHFLAYGYSINIYIYICEWYESSQLIFLCELWM